MSDNFYHNELWKEVHFLGLKKDERYQISSYGRLRNFDHDENDWRIMKTTNASKDGTGYIYFTWFKSSRGWKHRITKPIHRLVAEAFCDRETLEHKFVIHIDYNKTNNYFENLRWVTQKSLTAHNQENPRVIHARNLRKGRVTNSKLTESDVKRLKMKLSRGKNKLYKLAKEFGITHTQLNRIRSGENWGHVDVED